jgi:acyl carrier protein
LDKVSDRLVRCFSVIFPDLSREMILQASPETVSTWDSLMMVTLVAVIEEEFGLTFEFYDIEHLNSYSNILGVLQGHLVAPLS